MISYRAAVASALGAGNKQNGDNFYFNTRYLTEDLADSQVLLSHKKTQKGLQIYAVSDGSGAESFMEETSTIIVKNLLKYHKLLVDDPNCDVPSTILDYIDETNKMVNRNIRATNNHDVYGTLALLCVERESTLVCSIGDSRVYKFSRGRLQQLTEDHTQAQKMVSLGLLDASKASSHIKRNKLTQYFGEMPEGMTIKPYMDAIVSNDGDMYLICTKGFYETVSNDTIAGILSDSSNPADAVDELMAYATDRGLRDDATIIVVQAEETEGAAVPVGAAIGASAAAGAVPASGKMFKSNKTTLFAEEDVTPAETSRKQYEEYNGDGEEGESVNGFFGKLFAPFRKGGVKDPNQFWPSLIIFAVCILAVIIIGVVGYNMFSTNRNNDVKPTDAPAIATESPEPEATEVPIGEITPFNHSPEPTKDPNATPSPEPKLEKISITAEKKEVSVGDDWGKCKEKCKIKVTAYYDNKDQKDVLKDAKISGYDSSKEGKIKVKAEYKDMTDTVEITVKKADKKVTKITITADKKEVNAGTSWEDAKKSCGIKVTAYYDDNSTADVMGPSKITGNDFSKAGTAVVTAKYEDPVQKKTFSDSVTINVKANPTPTPKPAATVTSLSVSGQKTNYVVGDSFEKPTVHADYSDGSSKNVSGDASFSGYDMNTAGPQTVTVSFDGKSTTYQITVADPV